MSTKSTQSKARGTVPALLLLGLALCLMIRWPAETAEFLSQAGARAHTFVTELATR